MAERLTKQYKKQLKEWIGTPNRKFTLLYQITRDGCNGPAFHQRCDNKGPTVTLFYNPSGCVYGGYTSQSWTSSGGWKADDSAFLFRLNYQNKYLPYKYGVKQGNETDAIYDGQSCGPTFGGGHDLSFFRKPVVKNPSTGCFQISAGNIGHTYNNGGQTMKDITSGDSTVTELEVYSVEEFENLNFVLKITEGTDEEDMEPWRKTNKWNKELFKSLKDEVESYSPLRSLSMRHVQILLIGPVGSGKSSFFNTINSIFRGRMSSQAATGSVQHSLTTQYRRYKILIGRDGKPLHFRLCDTMGLEEGQGVDATDIPFILDGNIPDGFQFNPATHISLETAGFNGSPANDDKIQCVAMVLDSSQINVLSDWVRQKILAMRHHINHRGIPLVVLLTKVDKVCPLAARDISSVFRSEEVLDVVNKVSELLGIPGSHIFPVKNYSMETERDTNVDILALMSMRQMLWYADDHLLNMAESLETENLSKMNIKP